ncbi:hypothetical protein A3D80_04255 [Candidatus Roizmanbacteria bacterium RIFCSPHIGHO2_02_FULL_40_13b]|uniref:Uncharacterized protein n=1 Tax=Candidatus Roizmanbacteria bacterium RIFCSPHIGHO2_01_FULL_39_24 TaxID=1802032 RepID=A0A1F7GFK3_9BACT|nr:MAG: hypothetical protein A2799_03465 [Candidatus Roizmanbacteria bacterium RIFCSPHIGHO2_01_FULL_39_24]OGK27723.1 MAG: hypothetical protein A3D80_04255 [Candidatus Roizmanbacteria bacterium RIFCSPHIGHO2_02_FULL_40_13b]OGK49487.1 MAG: hypothetical protein A3A56_01945 [Candidatus Roizmanbacteria bacterium RIFCSPLOWO2_01_FULL_40_32]OGK56670.1 MAG: hypothetical protein A3H83_01405 [Candidatus Roizmanbacteria bacterium RIFCSPLOWO2_02_FULL_39_8]
MLTTSDLRSIRQIVSEETRSIIQEELLPIRADIEYLKDAVTRLQSVQNELVRDIVWIISHLRPQVN